LMPEIAIDVLHPGDIEDPKRRLLNHQDLVVMLSWSSTTAEMVQLASNCSAMICSWSASRKSALPIWLWSLENRWV
jgi:D-arabinose 5-phosphate isomerase GutQ